MNNTKKFILSACALAVIGSFLPWASLQTIFGSIDVAGTSGDGQITLVIALVVAGFCWFDNKVLHILATVAAGIGELACLYDIINISGLGGNEVANVSVDYGLYFCFIAFIGAFLGALSLAIKPTPKVIHSNAYRVGGW